MRKPFHFVKISRFVCIASLILTHVIWENYEKGATIMSRKREKGKSQKGQPNAETVKQSIAAEELEQAIYPTKRQNSPQ